ncbi:MAG: thioredoxin [Blastocatellia bacterium]|mgnify:CR=1 FL=1
MKDELSQHVVQCPRCRTKNRVRSVGGQARPVCGKCGATLETAPAMPAIVTDTNFDSVVAKSKIPVLLDMWAAWCGPCRMIAPTIERLAAELAGQVLVAKLDVDANAATANRFRVQSIPTLLVIKDGHEVDRLVGLQTREAILKRLENHITLSNS